MDTPEKEEAKGCWLWVVATEESEDNRVAVVEEDKFEVKGGDIAEDNERVGTTTEGELI